ncbi:MAG: RES family NAD+ phosphorylase [Candidatus Hydrogenedentes bacterium]|nr:RES family NAD+ phosphorylase [Candidatus Hydrogenedentota bacterium]
MARKLCCPECFDDRFLRDHIFPSLTTAKGDCSFCGAANVPLIKPRALRDYFELLVSVYEPKNAGKTLVEWLKDDWQLFERVIRSEDQVYELLGTILGNQRIVRKAFLPSEDYTSEGLAKWDTLRDEMMHRNRWFLDEKIDFVRMGQLLDHLVSREDARKWYRARQHSGGRAFAAIEMGAPPKRLASHGRANPAGIPYLYLASTSRTAVAEIRPHTGDSVYVAEFRTPELRVVDLRNPLKSVSPFLLSDPDEIGQLRADLPLLQRLGEELTRPVLPHAAAIDYIPSQYLCEFIKRSGFDGVIYNSSVSKGFNLALFNPEVGSPKSVTGYKVRKVSVDVEPFQRALPSEG